MKANSMTSQQDTYMYSHTNTCTMNTIPNNSFAGLTVEFKIFFQAIIFQMNLIKSIELSIHISILNMG